MTAPGSAPAPVPAPDLAPVLEADGIGKSFGRNTVLKSAAFHATPGRITALMGRNGAGKTTLFRIAAGLLRPDYGRVAWRGVYQERPSLARLARSGLMYGAQGSALTRLFTLREHLAALVRAHGGAERVEETVETLALGPLLDHRPPRMSGGERQRASLALALVRAPACLLVDEPFAGVAPKDRPLVAHALGRLRDSGCAVVTSGHDVDDVFSVSDLVIWVTAGTSHWLGTPDEARLHHGFRRAYLGPRSLGAPPRAPGAEPDPTLDPGPRPT